MTETAVSTSDDREWAEAFGTIRSLLADPPRDADDEDDRADELRDLLRWGFCRDAARVHERWAPYLRAHGAIVTALSLDEALQLTVLGVRQRLHCSDPARVGDVLRALLDTPGMLEAQRAVSLLSKPGHEALVCALVASSRHGALRELELIGTACGEPLALALAQAEVALSMLNLAWNPITDAGIEALVASPCLRAPLVLVLSCCALGDGAARALASAPNLRALRELELDGNALGDQGVTTLAASPHLGALEVLNLNKNLCGDAGAHALATSPHLNALRALYLIDNPISDEAARTLRDRFGAAVYV